MVVIVIVITEDLSGGSFSYIAMLVNYLFLAYYNVAGNIINFLTYKLWFSVRQRSSANAPESKVDDGDVVGLAAII